MRFERELLATLAGRARVAIPAAETGAAITCEPTGCAYRGPTDVTAAGEGAFDTVNRTGTEMKHVLGRLSEGRDADDLRRLVAARPAVHAAGVVQPGRDRDDAAAQRHDVARLGRAGRLRDRGHRSRRHTGARRDPGQMSAQAPRRSTSTEHGATTPVRSLTLAIARTPVSIRLPVITSDAGSSSATSAIRDGAWPVQLQRDRLDPGRLHQRGRLLGQLVLRTSLAWSTCSSTSRASWRRASGRGERDGRPHRR